MRGALFLFVIAMLAAGCARKAAPAPASARPPAEEKKDGAPGDAADDADADASPRSTSSDPCEGGEHKRKR